MRIVIAVMGGWLLAAAGWAGAGEVKNLYQGEVPVASRQLESLAADKQAQWLDMDGDAARFRPNVAGGPAALQPLLSTPHWQRSGEPDGEVLRYRWRP